LTVRLESLTYNTELFRLTVRLESLTYNTEAEEEKQGKSSDNRHGAGPPTSSKRFGKCGGTLGDGRALRLSPSLRQPGRHPLLAEGPSALRPRLSAGLPFRG
jgi:hypothetical protein